MQIGTDNHFISNPFPAESITWYSLGTTRGLNSVVIGNRIRYIKWLQDFISSKCKLVMGINSSSICMQEKK